MELLTRGELRVPLRFIEEIETTRYAHHRAEKYRHMFEILSYFTTNYFIKINIGRKWIHIELVDLPFIIRREKILKSSVDKQLLHLLHLNGSHSILRVGVNEVCFFVDIQVEYNLQNLHCPHTEELVKAVWHPRRVQRWLDSGVELEDM
jgi:hypothetical protein